MENGHINKCDIIYEEDKITNTTLFISSSPYILWRSDDASGADFVIWSHLMLSLFSRVYFSRTLL